MAVQAGRVNMAAGGQVGIPQKPVEGVRPMEPAQNPVIQQTMKLNSKIFIGVYVIVIFLGVATGYILSSKRVGPGMADQKPAMVKTDKVAGSTDTKTFKDSATGVIEKGGLGVEGSHKLIRDGGPSQTAYLISSVVDLDEYAGKKVRVWGQTMTAKKVSWLMDVGKVERLSE
ncbi:hypothetical protein A3A63_00380 [Candidatus Gottesmanbacteria bacterium RIFCSPLOWO2_01_FULL_46_9]|uniref:Uncharacterized protein n=1 Tax=Candidatus Gottesmanbacteria bacterium RIFCSPLOWO2_01_FULL_46_9 TaxID=1798394 RepID=A0A1F6B3Q2_9BACT|nr:MAG: hypothetical protein A3A63_00380 [Candidatus Gottesmanbacteria bacterium RIFCSPLOWO2_01_FULL_46_9]